MSENPCGVSAPLSHDEYLALKREVLRMEDDPGVSKRALRLFLQSSMSCGHMAASLLMCDAKPFGCAECNAAALTVELCEDEGCPHHGTPHICVSCSAAGMNDRPKRIWLGPDRRDSKELVWAHNTIPWADPQNATEYMRADVASEARAMLTEIAEIAQCGSNDTVGFYLRQFLRTDKRVRALRNADG